MNDSKKCEQQINSSLEPLSIDATVKILEQMKSCVCKIFNTKQGTGFFVKIPYKNRVLPVLITNNHVIGENDIMKKETITVYLNNEKIAKKIKFDNERIYYINKKLDVTIIEIKENKDDIKNFLELDDKIKECLKMDNSDKIQDFLENIYMTKSIYSINYPEGKKVVVSYAQPPRFSEQKIRHKCITKEGSLGSPILLSENQIIAHNLNKKFIFYIIENLNKIYTKIKRYY